MLLLPLLLACATRTMPVPGPLAPIAGSPPAPVRVHDLPPAATDPAPPPSPAPPPTDRATTHHGLAIARAARHHLTHAPAGFRNDCSGFVMAAFARAGQPLAGSTRTLWADAEANGWLHAGPPQPGDLAFYDHTYDRNRNGKRDDPLSHVAIVVEVEPDGTVVLAHGGTSKGRTTMRMHLGTPSQREAADGRVLNDWLRARRRGEPEDAAYLAGELFRGWARWPPPE